MTARGRSKANARPVLAISIGCPSGIGPEVAVVAASKARSVCPVLVGDVDVIRAAARRRRVPSSRLVAVAGKRDAATLAPGQIGVWVASTPVATPPVLGQPSPAEGAAQLAWIDEATDLVRAGVADALVTGPVSKSAIAASGAPGSARFRGHTEHLQARLGADEVVMAFRSEAMTTALVTTHLPLRAVSRAITAENVASTATWLVRLLIAVGKRRPRLAIAGLNPHAGEGGIIGTEELRVIGPGIERARKRLATSKLAASLEGPIGAETAFRLHARGEFDGVVAMYHDQATIPMKLVGFGEAVNVSLGLPIVRTSVDHGTAYDLAGTGKADARGMLAAMLLAAELARPRPSRSR